MWNYTSWARFFFNEESRQPDHREQVIKDKIQAFRDFTKTVNVQQIELEVFNSCLIEMKNELENVLLRLKPMLSTEESDIGNHGTPQDDEFTQGIASLEWMLKNYPELPKKEQIQSAKEVEQITLDRIEHHRLVDVLVDQCLVMHQKRLDSVKDQIRNSPSLTFSK